MFNKVNDLEMSVHLAVFLNILIHKTKWLVIVTVFPAHSGRKHLMRFPRETSVVFIYPTLCASVPVGLKSCVVKT